MSTIKIQIDKKWVEAYPEETILQVARRNNIDIPTLCHDEQLKPYTSCFLCVVEVEGARTLQPSCATKVRDGMVVYTHNEKIEKSRKMALELLVSNHFADCLGPCKLSCPAGVDVQGYVALAAMGKYKEAIKLIKEKNPLPTVCGRVCTRPCELNCRRNIVDEGVAVDDIKRFVADKDLFSEDRYFPQVKEPRRERIAIVGSGPAGLSCAYYLAIEGYQIDIFEAREKPGGMLRYGIPQYRLPEEILDKEIEGIIKLGPKIHTGKALGKDFKLEDLFKEGYKAVFLALGAQKSTHISMEGEDLDGVLAGIEFLAQVKAGDVEKLSGTVAVIGGGNTAVDAARTALRLGAKKVYMVYRRTIKEMPANPEEIEAAQHEGIEILFLTNPKRYLGKNGKVTSIECIKMKLGEPDESGRRRPIPIEGSEFELPIDYVIEAIGQKPDLKGIPVNGNSEKNFTFKLTRWGTLETDPITMMTNIPGVFAAGDVVLGPATAIEAIAGGRKVANGIHHYITGKWIEEIKQPFISRRDNFRELTPKDYLKVDKKPRHKRPELNPEERIKSFDEVEKTFSENAVIEEAVRCLECGCKAFYDCDLQKYATEYQADQTAYIGDFQEHEKDTRHPFIEFDLNKCILCGRCVRVCEEVVGVSALGLVNRGFVTKIAPSLEKPLQETSCITCGLCVDTCPTGSITDELYTVKPGPWKTQKESILCNYCGIGCDRQVHIVGDQIVRMDSLEEGRVNPHGNMCFKGRFGYEFLYLGKRITRPYIKMNGDWKEVSYEEAIKYVTDKLSSLEKHEIYISPKLALEDFYQIQKFGRVVLNTNKIGTLGSTLFSYFPYFPMILNSGSVKEIGLSDNVLVIKSDLIKSHPVAHYELRKAVRDGVNVMALTKNKPQIARVAKWYKLSQDDISILIKLLIKQIIEKESYNKLCDYTNPEAVEYIKKQVGKISEEVLQDYGIEKQEWQTLMQFFDQKNENFIVFNYDDFSLEELKWILALQGLLRSTQIKTLGLTSGLNVLGQWLMGIHPLLGPGGVHIGTIQSKMEKEWLRKINTDMNSSFSLLHKNALQPDSLWIFGEDPLGTAKNPDRIKNIWKKIPLKLVFDSIWTETADEADVVFPMVPIEESGGLFMNSEGRFLYTKNVVSQQASHSMIATLADIARYMEYYQMPESLEAVRGDISRIIPWFDEIYEKILQNEEVQLVDYHRFFELEKGSITETILKIDYSYQYAGDGIMKWIYQYAKEKGLKQI